MCGTAFHQLSGAPGAKLGTGCDEEMEVFGYKDECVEPIGLIVPVVQHCPYEQFRSLGLQN
jgi:hypothetical protein